MNVMYCDGTVFLCGLLSRRVTLRVLITDGQRVNDLPLLPFLICSIISIYG